MQNMCQGWDSRQCVNMADWRVHSIQMHMWQFGKAMIISCSCMVPCKDCSQKSCPGGPSCSAHLRWRLTCLMPSRYIKAHLAYGQFRTLVQSIQCGQQHSRQHSPAIVAHT